MSVFVCVRWKLIKPHCVNVVGYLCQSYECLVCRWYKQEDCRVALRLDTVLSLICCTCVCMWVRCHCCMTNLFRRQSLPPAAASDKPSRLISVSYRPWLAFLFISTVYYLKMKVNNMFRKISNIFIIKIIPSTSWTHFRTYIRHCASY